jgi:hypothetical protein
MYSTELMKDIEKFAGDLKGANAAPSLLRFRDDEGQEYLIGSWWSERPNGYAQFFPTNIGFVVEDSLELDKVLEALPYPWEVQKNFRAPARIALPPIPPDQAAVVSECLRENRKKWTALKTLVLAKQELWKCWGLC